MRVVILSNLPGLIVRYMRANPGSVFIIAFELSLVGIATELWTGNPGLADDLGVMAFVLACVGVALQTIISARSGSRGRLKSPPGR